MKGPHLQIRSEKVAMETLYKDVTEVRAPLNCSNGREERPRPCGQQGQRPWGPGRGESEARKDSKEAGTGEA